MPALRFLCILMMGWLLLPAETRAQFQPGQWEQTAGPYGGSFLSLAQDPVSNILWASVEGAIYSSRDGGASWKIVLAEDLGHAAFAFNGNTIFAGHFVSHDAGSSWQRHQLPDSLIIQDYEFDPASGNLLVGTNNGVYISSDTGTTWTASVSGDIKRIWSFDGQVLFVATAGSFARWLYSDDGGATWRTHSFGKPIGMALGPENILYLMSTSSGDTTFVRTTDFGTTWLNGGPATCRGRELIGFTPDDELLYLNDGIVKLPIEDHGLCERVYLNQKAYTSSTMRRPIQAWLLGHDDVLYLDTGFGELIKAPAGSDTWEQLATRGIVGTSVHSIAVNQETGEIWAGTALHGLFKTPDMGENWSYEGFKGDTVLELSTGKDTAPQWLASDQDGLLNWEQATQSWQVYAPGGLRLSSSPPIYDASTQTYFFKTNNNVFYAKEGNDALTGIPTPANFFDTPALAAVTQGLDGVLYAIIRHKAVLRQKAFFRLPNPTGSWELVSENFYGAFTEESLLLMDSATRLWATSDSTLHLSEDLGKTWTRQEIATGLINDIVETPDGGIWVAHARGIIRLENGTKNWVPAETGLRHKAVLSLAWHNKGGFLLAGTDKGGLYKIALAPPVQIANEASLDTPPSLTAGHFPNPVYSTATIHFTLTQPEVVHIQLFDQLGREVRQLANAQFPAGKHNVDVSFDALSPGVYLYKIETPSAQLTRMIMRVR